MGFVLGKIEISWVKIKDLLQIWRFFGKFEIILSTLGGENYGSMTIWATLRVKCYNLDYSLGSIDDF